MSVKPGEDLAVSSSFSLHVPDPQSPLGSGVPQDRLVCAQRGPADTKDGGAESGHWLVVLDCGLTAGDWLRSHLGLGSPRTVAVPFLCSHKSLSQGVYRPSLYPSTFLTDLCPP